MNDSLYFLACLLALFRTRSKVANKLPRPTLFATANTNL